MLCRNCKNTGLIALKDQPGFTEYCDCEHGELKMVLDEKEENEYEIKYEIRGITEIFEEYSMSWE